MKNIKNKKHLIFLLVLYIFDEKPENRIATQYIGKNHIK